MCFIYVKLCNCVIWLAEWGILTRILKMALLLIIDFHNSYCMDFLFAFFFILFPFAGYVVS